MGLTALIPWFTAGLGAAIGSLIMWVLVGKAIVLRYAGRAVTEKLANPDDDTRAALRSVLSESWEWFHTPCIDSGKVDDDEKPVIITPFQVMANEMGRYAVLQIRSAMGVAGRKRQIAEGDVMADLQNPDSPLSSISSVLPSLVSRAAKDGDYVPILLQMAQPWIEKLMSDKFGGVNGKSAGGWG